MAFLTLIAPLVALTYCIDKSIDGQAQGFNRWFKEYIFNLLIQPLHLLLYFVLVTSAFNLAGQNIIYSLVAIGFMIPAEKLLRKFFGFDNAGTLSAAGSFAGGALFSTMINENVKYNLYENDLPDDVVFGDEIAIDTEALGLNNFRDRLCLVQITDGSGVIHMVHFSPNNILRHYIC